MVTEADWEEGGRDAGEKRGMKTGASMLKVLGVETDAEQAFGGADQRLEAVCDEDKAFVTEVGDDVTVALGEDIDGGESDDGKGKVNVVKSEAEDMTGE